MYFKTEGVILNKRNIFEADRLLSIYTRDFGKVKCIAKGARRPRSKKSGHIELGNWCKIFIAKGKNIDILTEVELKKAFGIKHFSEDKANRIYHLLELVDKLTEDHHKNAEVFYLLISFLQKAAQEENFMLVSSIFKAKLLSYLGFFSATALPNSKSKLLLELLEKKDFAKISSIVNLEEKTHLKLLSFLDSIIENLTQSKLKTTRFLYE